MKIDVVISADHIKESDLSSKAIVVIDMLRATSVMVTAIGNGAKRVIPTLTIEEAFHIKNKLKEDVVLGGERQAKKIEGFDFSNSPLEFTKDKVEGKTVVMSTTNGTRALTLSSKGERVFIASVLNAKAMAQKLVSLNMDIILVNAGTNGAFSTDDFICSGYIISEIMKEKKAVLTDIAKVAKEIYENNKDIRKYIEGATHYEVLKSLNLEADIDYCSTKDMFDIVVEYKNGELK